MSTEIAVFLRHAKRSHATKLDLSNKQLSSIPKQLLSLRNIERLDLSHNKIEYIEGSINELYKLKELDLSHNHLTQIPSEIASLPLLSVLKLQGNPLQPKFQNLALPLNQQNPRLAEALRECFESGTKQQKAPEWLIESSFNKQQISSREALWSGQQAFKLQKKFSRKGDRRKMLSQKIQNQKESTFKNGVLQINFGDLKIGEQVSMGGFSTIHRGQYMGSEVAIKKVFNPNISEQLIAQFNNQITMLSRYRHPNIVLLLGVVTVPPNLCIVMQYFKQGTLKKTPIMQNQKTLMTRQILLSIQYLHQLGIVHRDIKSHNILLDSHYSVRLCDFGLARHKSQLNTGPMQYSGTPTYMSPQLFLKKAYDMSVDIFALGTMLYQIYSGDVPYHGIDPADIKDRVLKDSSLPFKIGMKKSISQIINKCRNQNPALRPTIKQLVQFGQW